MRDTKKQSFFKWSSHCLIGHVVLSLIAWTIPMFFVFRDSMYIGGVMSLGRVLYLVSLVIGGGVIVATLFWFTVSRPLIRRRDKGL